MASEFKRPPHTSNRSDPEAQYRAGFQHGAQRVREMIQSGLVDTEALAKWIEIDLQKWRHDPETDWQPPDPS